MSQESLLEWTPPPDFRFNGPEYIAADDRARLTGQICRVRSLMLDHAWRTVSEISAVTGDPEPSVSAQLRHLRKPRFGAYIIERQSRGDRKRGLFEYRLLSPDPEAISTERGADAKQTIIALRARVRELEAQVSALVARSEVAR